MSRVLYLLSPCTNPQVPRRCVILVSTELVAITPPRLITSKHAPGRFTPNRVLWFGERDARERDGAGFRARPFSPKETETRARPFFPSCMVPARERAENAATVRAGARAKPNYIRPGFLARQIARQLFLTERARRAVRANFPRFPFFFCITPYSARSPTSPVLLSLPWRDFSSASREESPAHRRSFAVPGRRPLATYLLSHLFLSGLHSSPPSRPVCLMSTQRRKVWLDCDPGRDDLVAILFALHLPQIELIGLSSVSPRFAPSPLPRLLDRP